LEENLQLAKKATLESFALSAQERMLKLEISTLVLVDMVVQSVPPTQRLLASLSACFIVNNDLRGLYGFTYNLVS